MEKPLNITRDRFINNTTETSNFSKKEVIYRTSLSLHASDLEILEDQIDRAIKLKKRSKGKTSIMRMALAALQEISDEKYLELYSKF